MLSESKILLYLARKSGKLIPADEAGQAQVVRWCFAALNTVEFPMCCNLDIPASFTGKDDPGAKRQIEFTTGWAHRHLGNLERWLEGREYVATDSFTVADILMSLVLSEIQDGVSCMSVIRGFRRIGSGVQGPPMGKRLGCCRARVEVG